MVNIILLGLTSFFTDVASEMVYPLLPLFLTSTLGAGPALLGLIEGFAESLASLLRVFSGYISDRIGRRKELAILGYSSSALGKAFLFLASGWGWVLGGRIVDRFGKGIRTAPRDALIAESAAPGGRGKAFGIHRGMDTAGAVLGVVIALAILGGGSADYRAVFFWSLIPASLGVAILFLVRDTARKRNAAARLPPLRWHLLPRRLRRFLVITFVFALGNSSNTFLLLRVAGGGDGTQRVLLAYLVYNVMYMVCSYPAGAISDRIGRRKILAGGYIVYGLVYFGFANLDHGLSAWTGWALFAAYGVYSGLTDGIEKALVADLAPPEYRATAIGMHATAMGIGLLPASLMAGALWEFVSPAAPFLLGGALGLAAATGITVLLHEE